MISVKLRPVKLGAPHSDVFGYKHANAYMYGSEYQAGQNVCGLQEIEGPIITGANQHIRYPVPSTDDASKYVRSLVGVEPPAIWIQHETGLEILWIAADIATLITAAGMVFKAFEAIRKKISENASAKETDRYWKRVEKLRTESRRLDSQGNVIYHLIACQNVHEEFHIQFDP